MKISNTWLTDYVRHDLSPETLADTLTMGGLEVEDVETTGQPLAGVVVGHVLDVRPHPNADRLTLCSVDLGDDAPVQIVCGAPNVAAGQRVPVATVGTTLLLPDRKNPGQKAPFTLKKAKIRGEASRGMICAEDELGLSDDHSGIMVLDPGAEIGQPFDQYLSHIGQSTTDLVLDIAITPNRPDAVSHIGVARDLAALTGRPLCTPEIDVPEPGGEITRHARVTIESPDTCGRYVALLVRGVTVRESPDWLQARLTAIGLRPRNNVVDVTNYVMYECGQPLHAFDFNQLADHAIIVRATEAESSFTTLDDKERTLPPGTLMICDAERPVAIGGVMGGENSEVTDETVDVLIESAYFDPSSIRRTAKALALQTDASYRFERGVDPDGQARAAKRAADLICDLADGTLVPGMIDEHPRPEPVRSVHLRPARVRRLLGVHVPVSEITRLLTAIGFTVAPAPPAGDATGPEVDGVTIGQAAAGGGEPALLCTVPTFRPDIEREVDLIEEVARLYGYDRIPVPAHTSVPYTPPRIDPTEQLRGRVLALLQGQGFREVYTNSLLPDDLARRFSPGETVPTLNAVSRQMTTLRPRLLPGTLRVAAHNQNNGQAVVRLMEFGHVFQRTDSEDTIIPGYHEREHLLLAVSGSSTSAVWDAKPRSVDLFDLKGHVDALLTLLRFDRVRMTPAPDTDLAVQRLKIEAGGRTAGTIGRVSDATAESLGLTAPVFFAELDWQTLVKDADKRLLPTYRPISRYPLVGRDLSISVAAGTPVGDVLETVRRSGGQLLQSVSLFDVYEGEQAGSGMKSLAFALRFGADRTLVDREVDQQMGRILKQLERRHQATLR